MRSIIGTACMLAVLLAVAISVTAADYSQWVPSVGAWTVVGDGYVGNCGTAGQFAVSQNPTVSLASGGGWAYEADIDKLTGIWPGVPGAANIGLMLSLPSNNWYNALIQALYRSDGFYLEYYGPGGDIISAPIASSGTKVHLKIDRPVGSNRVNVELTNELGAKVSIISPVEASLSLWSKPGLSVYNGSAKYTNISFSDPGYPAVTDIKSLPDNSPLKISSYLVTAVFSGYFYMESQDRKCGIRVDSSSIVAVGDRVDVTGQIQIDSGGELHVDAATVTVLTGAKVVLQPLGVSNKSIGGGAFGYQNGVNSKTSGSWVTAAGLNNIGLLVKTWGQVTNIHTGYFYIDDGSGVSDGSSGTGVKVMGDIASDQILKPVCVTGASSCEISDGHIVRMIRATSIMSLAGTMANASRELVDLSGSWEYQTVANLGSAPLAGPWGTTYVGTASGVDYPVSGLAMRAWDRTGIDYWYRTNIPIPSSWSGRVIKLRFESVQHTARIYVNGVLVATNTEGYTPFEVDVTNYVTLGASNQILVGVLDGRSAAIPSQVAPWFVGIRGKVEAVAYRNVRASDVFVKPSVRNMSLGADVTLKNEAGSAQTVTVTNSVYDGSTLVKALPSTQVTINAGAETTIRVAGAWANPVFWSPENPKLYSLTTQVVSGGEIIDSISTRFGFREFWSIGSDFYLNGTKIKPRAYFCSQWPDEQGYFFTYATNHGMTTAQAYLQCMDNGTLWNEMKNLNVNCIRLFGGGRPALELDSADAAGMMVVLENVLSSWPHGTGITQAQQDACLAHAQRVAKYYRNHPSIIMWSGGNEQFGNYPITKSICQQQIDLIRTTDPTRPVENSGYWDDPTIGGKAFVYDLHYPTTCTQGSAWGVFPDMPNHFYWPVNHSLPIWGQIDSGPNWPATSPDPPIFAWDKQKPLLCGENLAGVGEWTAAYQGDSYYLTDWSRLVSQYWKIQQCRLPLEIMSAEAYRLSGVSAITVFGLWIKDIPNAFYNQLAKYVLSPMGVFVKEYDNHFFGNNQATRNIVIWNDGYAAKSLTAYYTVKLGTTTLLSSQQTMTVNPAETAMFPITFTVPVVGGRQALNVSLSLYDGATKVYDRDYVWYAYPEHPGTISPTSQRFALYDPLGQTGPILTKAGAQFDLISSFGSLSGYKALVFGIKSLAQLSNPTTVAAQIKAYANTGGNVIVFEQDSIPTGFLPVNVSPVPRGMWPAHSICWTKQGDTHSVLTGLGVDDLQYWKGDNIVSSRMMTKPNAGNIRILADSGYDEKGLCRTPLLEMPYGQGTYVVSELDVTSKYDTEPVAQILVKNMLDYSLAASHTVTHVGILADAQSTFGNALTQVLGVSGDFISISNISSYDTLIIDGTTLANLDATVLQAFASNGGTVILHAMTSTNQSKLAQLLGGSVSVSPASLVTVTTITADPLTSGIGSYNLYWVDPYVNPDTFQQFVTDGLKYRVTASGATSLTSNSGLMREVVGQGRIIIDQYLWEDQTSTNNANKAMNYASTLYTNLRIQLGMQTGYIPHDASQGWVANSGTWTVQSGGYNGNPGAGFAIATNPTISFSSGGGWKYDVDMQLLASYWPGTPGAANVGIFITTPSGTWYQALAQVLYRSEGLYAQFYSAAASPQYTNSAAIGRTTNCHLKLTRYPGSSTLAVELTNSLGEKASITSPSIASLSSWTKPGLMVYNGSLLYSGMIVSY